MAQRPNYLTQADGSKILLADLSGALIIGYSGAGALVQDPRYLTWDRWQATLYADLSIPVQPMPESMWREWAKQVYQTTNLPPDPIPFADWREWALSWIRST